MNPAPGRFVENAKLLHITTVPMTLAFLRGQVEFMSQRSFAVRALSSPGPELEEFGRRESVPVHSVEMPRAITPVHDVRAIGRVLAVLRQFRPHIVHAHTPKGGLLGMVASWLARVPVRLYHMHGLPLVTAMGLKRSILRRSEILSCRLATHVLCVSHSVRQVAIDEGICPPDKISVLSNGSINGVDAHGRFNPGNASSKAGTRTRAQYAIPLDATLMGFVGRLVRDKGIIELETAWQRLRDAYPKLHLMVVGPWEPRDPVPSDVRARLEADPRVHFVGVQWNTPPLYAAMDIVVLPTYREGLPVVPLEAAAMELPVIATRTTGCVDAIADNVTGILVPPRDADALAAAMRRYVDNSDLRREHGIAARQRVLREFRQDVIWEAQYVKYLELLARQGIHLRTAG